MLSGGKSKTARDLWAATGRVSGSYSFATSCGFCQRNGAKYGQLPVTNTIAASEAAPGQIYRFRRPLSGSLLNANTSGRRRGAVALDPTMCAPGVEPSCACHPRTTAASPLRARRRSAVCGSPGRPAPPADRPAPNGVRGTRRHSAVCGFSCIPGSCGRALV